MIIRLPSSIDWSPFFGGSRVFHNPAFVRDANAVAEIGAAEFDRAMSMLETHTTFLSTDQARKLLAGVVEERQAIALANFVLNFHRMRMRNESRSDFAETTKRQIADAKPFGADNVKLEVLASRLDRLLRPCPAFFLQVKAEALTERSGASLQELSLSSDLRPVFDEKRERVEGMIPMTTLVVTAATHDGEAIGIEAFLTEAELANLCEEAEAARKKLVALKKLLAQKEIAVPATGFGAGSEVGEVKQ